MPLDAVLFDMDGLLLDTERLHMKCWKLLFEQEKVDFDIDFMVRTAGSSGGVLRRTIAEKYGEDFPWEHYSKMKSDIFTSHLQEKGVPVKEGVADVLDYLERKQIQKYVVTSTREDRAKRLLMEANLIRRFVDVIGGGPELRPKPEPDLYNLCVEKAGLNKENIIALEDSINGVNACAAANINVIGIPDMLSLDAVQDTRLIAILDNLAKVPPFLEQGYII